MINFRSEIFTVNLCLKDKNLVLLIHFSKIKIKNSNLVYEIFLIYLISTGIYSYASEKFDFLKLKMLEIDHNRPINFRF